MFLRSFAVQGSWNYRTLLGTGFAFALLPALRAIYRGRPRELREAVARHTRLFNSHPYLAPMALGAVATLEAAGEDPAVVDRFKMAVRSSLGSLGDRLIWAGWRPVCLLLALALLLAGAPWWVGVGTFLVVYNAGHLGIRLWSYRLGLRGGKAVGERLRGSHIGQVQRVLGIIGAFLAGVVIVLAPTGVAAPEPVSPVWTGLAVAGAVAGMTLGNRLRTPVVLALIALGMLGILVRMVT